MDRRSGMLVLEDGSSFVGASLAADGEWVGEVVFDTSMAGYQETITDASCWGQMVVFTYPHIGNVGVNAEDVESRQPWVRAVLARQICTEPSNWRSQQSLPDYLRQHGVPALSGIDTRRLTLTLREKGVLRGALSTVNLDYDRLLEMARTAPDMSELAAVEHVTAQEAARWTAPLPEAWNPLSSSPPPDDMPHVVVLDVGFKENIARVLVSLGARVTVMPASATYEQILAAKPDGVLVSNGPGDPEQATDTIATVRQLVGRVPLFGLCLGHQIIALACGARTFKLPFGHHGGNHPVQDLATGAIEITAHNHNYSIAPDSLEGLPLEVTRVDLYDGTIEGLRHTELPIVTVQYHPEASPGPHDSLFILRDFVMSLSHQS